jgi:addiction module RelE/StbE family toxin
MAEIRWANIALQDLNDIYEYISQDSEKYAERLIDRLIERVDIFIKNPMIGGSVREVENDSIRELIESNYRIIYQVETKDKIGILRVLHGSRLLNSL